MGATKTDPDAARAARRVRRRRASIAAMLALAGLLAYGALPWRRQPPPPPPDLASDRTGAVLVEGSCPTPVHPAGSTPHKDDGVVMLNFLVGVDGAVVDSRVETSSGHPQLDEAARLALSRCRFRPGTYHGRPEDSWHIMKYDWGAGH
jgi:TonB family protein